MCWFLLLLYFFFVLLCHFHLTAFLIGLPHIHCILLWMLTLIFDSRSRNWWLFRLTLQCCHVPVWHVRKRAFIQKVCKRTKLLEVLFLYYFLGLEPNLLILMDLIVIFSVAEHLYTSVLQYQKTLSLTLRMIPVYYPESVHCARLNSSNHLFIFMYVFQYLKKLLLKWFLLLFADELGVLCYR